MTRDAASAGSFKQNTSTQPAVLFLSRFGIAILAILLVMAAWAGQTVVVVLLGLALSAAGLSRLWSYLSLKRVHGERQLTENRVFPGEDIELKLRVVNRKLLPLPWVQVTDEVPSGFVSDHALSPGLRAGFGSISRSASLLWYSAVNWKFNLRCNRRGYFALGPVSITSGDIFGFYPRTAVQPASDYITVYPRIYPLTGPALASLFPLGESKSEKRLFEDPSRTIGVRDYVAGDSLRRIHWKASARHQTLQVKVFEPTTTLKSAIFLAIDSFQKQGLWLEDQMELGISTAASLANCLVEMRSQAGVWVNSKLADSGLPARIPPGAGIDQLARILDVLAKVTSVIARPFVEFFRDERASLPLGTSLIFIASQVSTELKDLLSDLHSGGYKLRVFKIGEAGTCDFPPDLNCYSVVRPEDLAKPGCRSSYD